MKIYVCPADEYGCGYFRLIWPALALKAQGVDIEIIMPTVKKDAFTGAINNDDVLVDIKYPDDADVIVMQRVTHKHLHQAVKMIRARGVAVVVDMDDDLSSIHQHNPAWSHLHPKSQTDHSWEWGARACDDATLVTVSTDALKRRYGRHGRVHVLRNAVPEFYLDIPHVDRPVFGWGGSLHSHPNDVPTISGPVSRLVREGYDFRIVGDGAGIQRALNLEDEVDATGPLPIEAWPHSLATLGVGVAPLGDTLFNAAKSWLKPLEYAALGVPVVMAPRAEYRRIHDLGIGLLADKSKTWYTQIRALLDSTDYRLEMSEKGREVARTLTVETNAWRWGEAWLKAFDMQNS